MQCYLCSLPFDGVSVRQHGEHVLQNSIGGRLISPDILCEACGTILGDSVDSAFAREIAPISVLFNVARDRGQPLAAKAQAVAKGAANAAVEAVQFKLGGDFSITPVRPIHITDDEVRRVSIFAATPKQARQYAQSPALQKLAADGFEIVEKDNIAERIQELVLQIDVEAVALLRGILKVALGFAMHQGVARQHVCHLFAGMDLISDPATLAQVVFQYYPTTNAEKLFETEKSGHEDWFPNHQVYLFSRGRDLFCYVEIFGVVQKYVHLSSCYSGTPITEKFLQRVERWDYSERAFVASSASDLHILAGQFNVETAGRAWEDIQSEITQKAKSRAYELDPAAQIEKVAHLVGLVVEFSLLKSPEKFETVKKLLAKANEARRELGLSLLDDLAANPFTALHAVRADYSDFRIGSGSHFCPVEAKKVPVAEVRKYVAYKFFDLLRGRGEEDWLRYEVA